VETPASVEVYMKTSELIGNLIQPNGESCEMCGEFVRGFYYTNYCDGYDTYTSLGLAITPCVCSSDECYNKLQKILTKFDK